MYVKLEPFGYNIYGETIGSIWLGLIEAIDKNGVPLHKARTCVKSFNIKCGDCPTCWDRRRGYREAGIKDPTKYRFLMSRKYPTYYDHEKEEKNAKRNRN